MLCLIFANFWALKIKIKLPPFLGQFDRKSVGLNLDKGIQPEPRKLNPSSTL